MECIRDQVAKKDKRSVVILLVVYVLLSVFLGLGSYLFVKYPENEALGGMIMGLASLIFGIILPFHLLRTKVIEFEFLSAREGLGRVVITTFLFAAFFLLVFPSGILWQRTTLSFIENPLAALPAASTFLSLLWATVAYGFIFWGGMLHALKRVYGSVVAVLVTSFLFSIYHFSQFFITPPTLEFLLKVFVGGLMLAAFTLWSRCVLPTLIVHQLGQFFHFVILKDNPFAEDIDRFIPSLVMLLLFFGVYEALFRRIGERTETVKNLV